MLIDQAKRRIRIRIIALTVALAVLLWDASAYALNGIVSQDLPILTQMLAQQIDSHIELTAILSETAAVVAQVKEYTTIAKTVYRGVEELLTLDIEDVRAGVLQGLGDAYPEIADMREDITDIRDLRYSDPQSVEAIRGMLWQEVYGPAFDEAVERNAEHNLETAAEVEERKSTHEAYIDARRKQWDKWQDDCEKAGPGACQRAADAATVENTQLLADIHETLLLTAEIQSREQLRKDRQEVESANAAVDWIADVEAYIASFAGGDKGCVAGQCVWERYQAAPDKYQPPRRSGREYTRREREARGH